MASNSATDPTPVKSRYFSVQQRGAAVILCALIVLLVASYVARQMLNDPPFRMTIEPEGDHAIVRFFQPGKNLISPPFRTGLRVDRRHEIVLDSRSIEIPGGQIEFWDTTILPGRFTIRLGETLFDVMSAGIDVNGSPTQWLANDAAR